MDGLYARVARKVLNESLSLQKGECLTVETWNTGLPFARHVVVEARRMGAVPLTVFEDEDAYVEGVKKSPDDTVGEMGKQERALLSRSDVYVFIPGPVLGSYSHRLTREEVVRSTRYNEAWYKAASKAKLRGVRMTFGYIGPEAEGVLGKSVEALVSHQLEASLADYRSIGRKAKEIVGALGKESAGTIKTPGSSLKLRFTGITEVDDGVVDAHDVANESNVCYIPPGFVYAEVEPESVSGTFTLSPTVTRFGLIADGTMELDGGEVVSAKSSRSSAPLKKVEEVAGKNRRVSSVTIGLNPLLKYGYGQNANSAGVIGVRTMGVNFTAKAGSFSVVGKTLVRRGRL